LKIAICVYTIFMIFVFWMLIRVYLLSGVIKECHALIKNKEYLKALEIFENNKLKMIFGRMCYAEMVYLYFINNDYEKYINAKEKCLTKSMKKNPDKYFSITQLLKITEVIFMYMHEDIKSANTAYKELITDSEGTDKDLYYKDNTVWILFQVSKMMYFYNTNNHNEAKWIYECISTYAYNITIKTLISYYMCKIYETEGNYEAINSVISHIDIQNNPYGVYFDKWGEKQ